VNPALVVLAAGLGTRYGGLKQIEPVGPKGEYLLDYAVYDAIRAGFKKVVFVITKSMEREFTQKVSSRYSSHLSVYYAFQELGAIPKGYSVPDSRLKPWGTGHAVLVARDKINEPFAVINADDYYGPDSYKVIFRELASRSVDSTEMCMVGFPVENTLSPHGKVSRGVCTLKDSFLVSVVEREEIKDNNGVIIFTDRNNNTGIIPPGTFVSMNLWGLAPETMFPILEEHFNEFMKTRGMHADAEFYLPAAVNYAIETGKITVKVLRTSETWFGLTHPGDKRRVQCIIASRVKQGIYPERLF